MPSSSKAYHGILELIDTIVTPKVTTEADENAQQTTLSIDNTKVEVTSDSIPNKGSHTSSINKSSMIDLGSGWGNIVLRLAKRYPNTEVIGYEVSILPWLISILLKKLLRINNLTLLRQDFYQVKLPDHAIIVCYLFPEAMAKINNQLLSKSKASFLISNTFALPSQEPSKTIKINDFYKSPIYLYKLD